MEDDSIALPSAVAVTAERLANLIQDKAGELLMLDLRSFMSYNQCHLQSSINVCIPSSLLKRKTFSLSNVESTIGCDKSREKFKNRQGADIVVYDSDCEKVKKNCGLSTLLQKLKDESLVTGVYFLHGGRSFSFLFFSSYFPPLEWNVHSKEREKKKKKNEERKSAIAPLEHFLLPLFERRSSLKDYISNIGLF